MAKAVILVDTLNSLRKSALVRATNATRITGFSKYFSFILSFEH
jgi:hypothetical protein